MYVFLTVVLWIYCRLTEDTAGVSNLAENITSKVESLTQTRARAHERVHAREHAHTESVHDRHARRKAGAQKDIGSLLRHRCRVRGTGTESETNGVLPVVAAFVDRR